MGELSRMIFKTSVFITLLSQRVVCEFILNTITNKTLMKEDYFGIFPETITNANVIYNKAPFKRDTNMASNQHSWRTARRGKVPPGAVIGGHTCSDEAVFVVRAKHENAVVPGRLVSSEGCATITWKGSVHCKDEYEVLVDFNDQWSTNEGESIPETALQTGFSGSERLYTCRVHFGCITFSGRTSYDGRQCFIAYNEFELAFRDFDVLTP